MLNSKTYIAVDKLFSLLSKKKGLLDDIDVYVYEVIDDFHVICDRKSFSSVQDLLEWYDLVKETNKQFRIKYGFYRGSALINLPNIKMFIDDEDDNEPPIIIKIKEEGLYTLEITITSMFKVKFDGYYTHYNILNDFIKEFKSAVDF